MHIGWPLETSTITDKKNHTPDHGRMALLMNHENTQNTLGWTRWSMYDREVTTTTTHTKINQKNT